jgi:hypothetical protein
MSKPIPLTLGTPVKFDSEHGMQRGHIIGIHQLYVIVEVDGNLAGCTWKVERTNATLQQAAA